jgi:hypothetical protein
MQLPKRKTIIIVAILVALLAAYGYCVHMIYSDVKYTIRWSWIAVIVIFSWGVIAVSWFANNQK